MEIAHNKINNWNVVLLQGPFTIKTVQGVQEVITTVLQQNHPFLALNLTDVSYMDSSAIGVILAANRSYTQKEGKIVLFGANETITTIFNTIKLYKHIPLYKSHEAFLETIK